QCGPAPRIGCRPADQERGCIVDAVQSKGKPPRCGALHRTWRRVAECHWPRAEWVSGEGRFASMSDCPPGATVMLFRAREDAERAERVIDATGWGGRCWRRQGVVARARGERGA